MCHYEVVARNTLPEVVSTYPSTFMCKTHDGDKPGEHWFTMYVDEIGDYVDPYRQKPQHAEFTNVMNEHCSQWSPNDHILQSPISTDCGQYSVAFLMFRCRNISMHAFGCLFTTDLNAKIVVCSTGLVHLIKNDDRHLCLLVMLTTSTSLFFYQFYVQFPDIQTPILGEPVHTVRLIKESMH